MILSAPALLTVTHDLSLFVSGQDTLDDWLCRCTRTNQESGASRIYVVCAGEQVVGYYCLSSGALAAAERPGALRRNMPDPIPMAALGRLAIDRNWQGKGLGAVLLQDAVLRTAQAAHIVGIRGVLVHALSEEAKAFCEHCGFAAAPAPGLALLQDSDDLLLGEAAAPHVVAPPLGQNELQTGLATRGNVNSPRRAAAF